VVAIAGVAQETLVRDQQGVVVNIRDFASDQFLKIRLPLFKVIAVERQDRLFDPRQSLGKRFSQIAQARVAREEMALQGARRGLGEPYVDEQRGHRPMAILGLSSTVVATRPPSGRGRFVVVIGRR
jgi:hypothetical protein